MDQLSDATDTTNETPALPGDGLREGIIDSRFVANGAGQGNREAPGGGVVRLQPEQIGDFHFRPLARAALAAPVASLFGSHPLHK